MSIDRTEAAKRGQQQRKHSTQHPFIEIGTLSQEAAHAAFGIKQMQCDGVGHDFRHEMHDLIFKAILHG